MSKCSKYRQFCHLVFLRTWAPINCYLLIKTNIKKLKFVLQSQKIKCLNNSRKTPVFLYAGLQNYILSYYQHSIVLNTNKITKITNSSLIPLWSSKGVSDYA